MLSSMCLPLYSFLSVFPYFVLPLLHRIYGMQVSLLTAQTYECRLFPQAYARKMNRCLLETSHNGNSPAIMQELREWSSQVNSLIVFLAVGNVRNFVAFTGTRLDGNQGPSVAELPDSWYQSFTVSCITSRLLGSWQSQELCGLHRSLTGSNYCKGSSVAELPDSFWYESFTASCICDVRLDCVRDSWRCQELC